MTIRTDLDFDMLATPRVITVRAPSTELTVQDLHDTATDFEQSIDGMAFDALISSAGKEELGGGVLVGITSTLQNAQVAFEIRTTVNESGTITTPDANGKVLIDSTATFVTNNVARGDLVLNATDGSHANVLSVDSETQLTCQALQGGTDNRYDSSDSYQVFDFVQCSISGGNLVAVDDMGGDLNPVFPTFGTQVVRSSSSSATLQELGAVQFSSFNGGITVDVVNGVSGTVFPTGTPEQPVNNLADALLIAAERGLRTMFIIGDVTLDSGTFDGFHFVGENRAKTTITVDAAASTLNTEYENATVTGTFDGPVEMRDCQIETATDADGFFSRCQVNGGIALKGLADTVIVDCWSGNIVEAPNVNANDTTFDIFVTNFQGDLDVIKNTTANNVSIIMNGGLVTLRASNTDGNFEVSGLGQIANNSGLDVVTSSLLRVPRLTDIHSYLGLREDQPLSVTNNRLLVGNIDQAIADDGTTTTVTRQ